MGELTVIEEYREQKRLGKLKPKRKPAEIHQFPAPKRPKLIKQTWFCSCGKENNDDAEECWKCEKKRPLW